MVCDEKFNVAILNLISLQFIFLSYICFNCVYLLGNRAMLVSCNWMLQVFHFISVSNILYNDPEATVPYSKLNLQVNLHTIYELLNKFTLTSIAMM
jgi:hypothetical protein